MVNVKVIDPEIIKKMSQADYPQEISASLLDEHEKNSAALDNEAALDDLEDLFSRD